MWITFLCSIHFLLYNILYSYYYYNQIPKLYSSELKVYEWNPSSIYYVNNWDNDKTFIYWWLDDIHYKVNEYNSWEPYFWYVLKKDIWYFGNMKYVINDWLKNNYKVLNNKDNFLYLVWVSNYDWSFSVYKNKIFKKLDNLVSKNTILWIFLNENSIIDNIGWLLSKSILFHENMVSESFSYAVSNMEWFEFKNSFIIFDIKWDKWLLKFIINSYEEIKNDRYFKLFCLDLESHSDAEYWWLPKWYTCKYNIKWKQSEILISFPSINDLKKL